MENLVAINLSEQDKDKIISSLLKDLDDIKKRVSNIENNKIIEELQLPNDLLEASGILSPIPNRLGHGRAARPLLESEIKDAQEKCFSATDCAKYLNVNYKTYRKYALKYGIFKTNRWGKGSKKRYWNPNSGKYPLNQILEGKYPNYPIHRLKDLLIRSGTKKAECEKCGFNERRVLDQKMPLLLNFLDDNEKNHVLENIEILCYNCTFLCGRGYIRNKKVEYNFSDPDKIQGAPKKVEARF